MRQIVWTGGSPSLYFEEIRQCIDELLEIEHSLETNGLVFDINNCAFFDRISVSPKQQNVNIDALAGFADLTQARFKFIFDPKQPKWWEKIIDTLNIPKERVYMMPLGASKEEHQKNVLKAVEYCKETGFNLAPRVHIMIWGKKRKV